MGFVIIACEILLDCSQNAENGKWECSPALTSSASKRMEGQMQTWKLWRIMAKIKVQADFPNRVYRGLHLAHEQKSMPCLF